MTEFNRIFLDTAPIIYYTENKPVYFELMDSFFTRYIYSDYISSTITIAEYFPIPYRHANCDELITNFYKVANHIGITFLEITREIAMKSAQIRAKYKSFKSMDSLQLACAIVSGCDVFLTNDRQLRQITEIQCILLDEWS